MNCDISFWLGIFVCYTIPLKTKIQNQYKLSWLIKKVMPLGDQSCIFLNAVIA
jgi:hypothetical protein